MLTGPELILVLMIVVIVFGLGKISDISKKLAHLRLHYDKGVASDIDITPVDTDASPQELPESQTAKSHDDSTAKP